MNKYEIDFLVSNHWFTYDVWATDIFNAACDILRINKNAEITNVTFMRSL